MYRQKFSSGSRGGSRFAGSRGGSRGRGSGPSTSDGRFGKNRGGGRGFSKGQYIDPNRFINKAVITEKVEHFAPEHNFIDFEIQDSLKKNIVDKGYVTPTPIQDKAIPHILRGDDLVGIANTGTGKTAAFLIPLINKILKNPKEGVLIVVPTRELGNQIQMELRGFTNKMKIYSVLCIGGASIGAQIRELRYKNEFVIGTPGRLKDLIERKNLDIASFKTVVLDEADRMLDMGFINDMKYLMSKMNKDRHTLFFSATLSKEIEKLISDFMKEPVTISVKTTETAEGVEQDVVRLRGSNKMEILEKLLREDGFDKVLIFGKTKHGVDRLSRTLVEKGFKAESIHGDKNQQRRQKALDLFKRDHVNILVATDVAARGLDINGVSHVINYDIPATYDDYVHRIGRTGRAGKKGKALTFIE
ncbi:MAG: DEAD/DEAH box helicase [Patescibacteria group bacterium]